MIILCYCFIFCDQLFFVLFALTEGLCCFLLLLLKTKRVTNSLLVQCM